MNLFAENTSSKLLPPLAERMRPQQLEAFIGQANLTDKDKILRKALENKRIFSMILWGPPGSGKTTLARIISREIESDFFQISAVSAGVKDVRNIILTGESNQQTGRKTILFIDEIHRFNKAQQDALLHAVESGAITLIGATTENPSFEVIAPLLSRCRVLKLQALSEEELALILDQALQHDLILQKYQIQLRENARKLLLNSVSGDARKLLNTLEIALQLSARSGSQEVNINYYVIKEALQQKQLLYDKKGDYHYDTISAFIKSVRGSDPDAAVYWLAVMLEGGEDPLFVARRLIILASEDIGNADPNGIVVASAAFQSVHAIGMPEGAIVLAQACTYLASAPKSNASYQSLAAAQQALKEETMPDVPLHLRNAPTGLMRALDYAKDYRYPHNHPEHFTKENYFPAGFKPQAFYHPTSLGYEKYLRERLSQLWPERYTTEPDQKNDQK
jgi:putative ATPase